MNFSRSFVVLCLACALAPVRAEHLGAIGPVYPIGEESALDMIMKKLRDKERTGEMKRLQEEATRRSMNTVKNMPPVDGVTTVHSRAQRLIDPTVTYPTAVTTDEGQIVVPAGAKINPLLITGLSKSLVFFDGRDKEQTEAVRKLVQKYQSKVKPILIAGSWMELTKAWKTQVFYDQHGVLSKRFGIRAVPTVIRQKGDALLLEEIPAEELR